MGGFVKFQVGIVAVWLAIVLFFGGCYIGNVVKLVKCDWATTGTWKGEVVHAVGLIPLCAVVTVWFDDK